MLGRTLLVLAVLACAAAAPAAAAANPWLDRKVLHIAHQGGEAEAPSNTYYAYEKALANGADVLEIDVNITSDGVPVVMHDTHLGRMCHREIEVNTVTFEQLKTYDAACTWPQFKGMRHGDPAPPEGFGPEDFRVHSLEEVLQDYPDVLLNIEIKGKAPDTTDAPGFYQTLAEGKRTIFDNARAIAEVLNRYRAGRHDAIVVSFSDSALQVFKNAAPAIDTAGGLITTAAFFATTGAGTPLPGAPNPQNVALQPPTYFQGIDVPTEDFVSDAHANGLAVHVWTTTAADETLEGFRRLIDRGVDGVMTDYPSRFEAALKPEERYRAPAEERAKARVHRAQRSAAPGGRRTPAG
jgi:glycerophosphoryl diester phosphodiesterase